MTEKDDTVVEEQTQGSAPVEFRKTAVEDAQAPGQLDLGVKIIRTPHWLLLLVVLALVFSAVGFSFVIKVPVKVQAQGILIPEEGLKDIESLTDGRVKDIMVKPGDFVRKGMRVAQIEQPDLTQKLEEAQAQLVNARKKLAQIKRFQSHSTINEDTLRAQKDKVLNHLIKSNKDNVKWLNKAMAGYKTLADKGYVSKETLSEARVKLFNAQAELIENQNKLNALVYEADSAGIKLKRELLELEIKVEETRRSVQSIRERRLRLGYVISPYTGVVVEQKLNPGEKIDSGQVILSILPGERVKADDGDRSNVTMVVSEEGEFQPEIKVGGKHLIHLVANLYISASDGKRVEPGMEVHIVPTTVKREEFGFMFAKITDITTIPATPEGMMRMLKNKQLVDTLSKEGAPFQTRAVLEVDPANYSGFRWSSPHGPEQTIGAGTMCSADVIIKEQPLIAMVMPAIKKLMQVFVE